MRPSTMCSQCFRALRQTIKAETVGAPRAQSHTVLTRRPLSTTSTKWQQKPSQKVNEVPSDRIVVFPTTASTITTNVTAPPPARNELESLLPSQTTTRHAPPQTPSNADAPPPSDTFPHPTPSQTSQEDKSSVQPASPASVAHMQHQIQSSLSSRGPKSLPLRLATSLQKAAPAVTRTYTIYGQTEAIFKSCAQQADYTIPRDERMNILTGKGPVKEVTQEGAELGRPLPENADAWWFNALNLPPTFSTWSQVTFLHMYVIIAQMRATLPSQAELQEYHRYLIEHFSREAEDKMILLHNLNAQGIRSRYLKDLLLQWRGILVSYDEGLVKGDAVLASAVWRNLFRADENVDWVKVASVVAFLRLAMRKTGAMSMDQLIAGLDLNTSVWPAAPGSSIATLIGQSSLGMKAPLE